MKTKLSLSRFYLSNIIFYTSLLAFPLSAAIKQVNQTETSNTLTLGSVNEWLEIDKTESIDEESSPKLTGDEQIIALINKLNKKNEQLEEQIAKLQSIIFIDATDNRGMTRFLCAAYNGQLAIAKLLKQRGAHISAKDQNGNNALHLACKYSGNEAMVTWLLDVCKIGLETEGFKRITPFLCAAKKGQLGIAKLLRKRGANVNAKDYEEDNALHQACLFSSSVPMVEWLLDACKIDIETKGVWNEKTPFLCAAEKGQLAIAKRLKERGANIHAKNKWGYNALYYAKQYSDSKEMISWLSNVCKLEKATQLNSSTNWFKLRHLGYIFGAFMGVVALMPLFNEI